MPIAGFTVALKKMVRKEGWVDFEAYFKFLMPFQDLPEREAELIQTRPEMKCYVSFSSSAMPIFDKR
jgi:hypothetical protein